MLPVKLGGQKPVPAREVFDTRHPWFADMGAALAAHDPDFLTAVADRFWDTHQMLNPEALMPRLACPDLASQTDTAASELLADTNIELLRRFASAPVQAIRFDEVLDSAPRTLLHRGCTERTDDAAITASSAQQPAAVDTERLAVS